jgi:perosamine synthetase
VLSVQERIRAATVAETASIRDAMIAIDRGALGIALLVDGELGVFRGLVTDGDLRRALLAGSGLHAPVADVPRPPSRIARAGTAPAEIAAMFDEPVRAVPLLDDAGHVVDLAMFDSRVRLPVAAPSLGERELRYVSECVLSGWVSSAGEFVTRFEELFATFSGTRHAVAVNNGTAALHLALLALEIGPGDEVIVPSFTFVATANAVTFTGATPVFVDSTLDTWTIDPVLVEQAVTKRTKAILPVHVYGQPADMDALLELARARGLAVVEDAAEAHGASYRGRPVGSLGDIGAFSFYGNKIVTTGEGGMLVTDNDAAAERLRVLRNHGMTEPGRYWHDYVGFNYRLTNLQAAVGVAQMERIDELLTAKAAIRAAYAEGLRDVPGIALQQEAPETTSVCWLMSVLVDEEEFGVDRDRLVAELGPDADTRPLFTPLHQQPIYARPGRPPLPVAERLGATGLSLPSAVDLREHELARVVDRIASIGERARSGAAPSSART